MKARKIFAGMLVAAMLVSSSKFDTAVVMADEPAMTEEMAPLKGGMFQVEDKEDLQKVLDSVRKNSLELMETAEPAADDMVHVIVTLEGESIVDMDKDAKMEWVNKVRVGMMEAQQTKLINTIKREILDGEDVNVGYQYTWLLNGFSLEVPYKSVKAIRQLSGVKDVIVEPVYEISKEDSAELKTVVDGEMIQREQAWGAGYTGTGMIISVIDTGLDLDHPNFQPLPEEKLTEDSLTVEKIQELLPELNAYSEYEGLTVEDVYYSTKVAYAFNYADRNLTVDHSADDEGTHGTHVAGIAAANAVGDEGVVGVAPDAQLLIMKVFGATRAGYTSDIIAALEDSLILGADVVNMSLGSTSGFSTGGEEVDAIYDKVAETGTVLCISAGNEATAGEYNNFGLDKNFAWDPDNATVGAPGTFSTATTVGSVNNLCVFAQYLACGDFKFDYYEGSSETNASIHTLDDTSLQFAAVGNCGQTVEDFEAADVAGKIALVSRGVTTFSSKVKLAEEAGAVACIVYNNQSGVIRMQLEDPASEIPAISVTKATGERLLATLETNPEVEIEIFDKSDFLPSEDAYKMSSFSSWGVTPDLMLEPDVVAPGGNIYSTVDGGEYDNMSGTSMAAPNVAGVTALIKQYAREAYDFTEPELRNFVNAVLMSTARPLDYDEETKYSPRQQGSGLASAYDAIRTRAYLSVDGMAFPKVNLYDDVEREGKYRFSYDVNNFGDKDLFFEMNTTVQTEDVAVVSGLPFMAGTPVSLDAATSTTSEDNMVLTYDFDEDGKISLVDAAELFFAIKTDKVDADYEFRYELDGKEGITMGDVLVYLNHLVGKETEADFDGKVLKIAAGESATIDVEIELTEDDKTFMDTYFESGIYVEGYSYLNALSANAVNLSLPYLGFYGDWTNAAIFDNSFIWEDDDSVACFYEHAILGSGNGKYRIPGMNAYFDEEFDEANIAFSPNEDGWFDSVDDLYVSLLRNVKTLDFKVLNAKTGDEYFHDWGTYFRKSSYNQNYGMCMPFVFGMYLEEGEVVYDFTDAEGNTLANNTKLEFVISATLDYDKHESDNYFDTITYPIVVDTQEPEAIGYDYYVEDQKEYLVLFVEENHNLMAGIMLDGGFNLVGLVPREETEEEGVFACVFDITGYEGNCYFLFDDYAFNEAVIGLNLDTVRSEYQE